ncbi:MAG: hypothetical protein ACE5HD_04635 [Acidobacteriota bacterium]
MPTVEGEGARLDRVDQIPRFLARFFRASQDPRQAKVENTQGLWPLLEWCWSLGRAGKKASGLCRCLISSAAGGWLDESDVLNAMARGSARNNPSYLTPGSVQPFAAALLAEGETVRGHEPSLDIHLEFLLPPIHRHPFLSPEIIQAALLEAGGSHEQLGEHVGAIHPERQPYRGTWSICIEDSRRALPRPQAPNGSARILRPVRLADSRVGRQSRVRLSLLHPPDLSGYFGLTLKKSVSPPRSAPAPFASPDARGPA